MATRGLLMVVVGGVGSNHLTLQLKSLLLHSANSGQIPGLTFYEYSTPVKHRTFFIWCFYFRALALGTQWECSVHVLLSDSRLLRT